ncbi:MAG: hypothetical protein HYU36_22705 [Planctomycetes bacterium]|nr:hypothetical protein [Planctomycetota bacterium]
MKKNDGIRDLTDAKAAAVVERHRVYWENGDAPAALFRVIGQPSPLADTPRPFYLQPESLDVERWRETVERGYDAHGLLYDDLFRSLAVGFPSEALAGCRIRVSGGTHWAEPCFTSWDQYDHFRLADSPWFRLWMENTKRAVDALGPHRYPFCCCFYRGPVDLASAVLTATGLLEAVLDRPREAHHFIGRLTDILIEAATTHASLLPAFKGGKFNSYGTWTPGTTVTFSVDNACLFNPRLYEEFFLPHDLRLCQAFERPFAHLHASARQHFRGWTEIPHLGLQCVIDDAVTPDGRKVIPIGPQLHELVADFQAIRKKKSLMLYGYWDEATIELALAELSPAGGLALDMRVADPEGIRRHLARDSHPGGTGIPG